MSSAGTTTQSNLTGKVYILTDLTSTTVDVTTANKAVGVYLSADAAALTAAQR